MSQFLSVKTVWLLMLFCLTLPAAAQQSQSVEGYFHAGAKHFINSELDQAIEQVQAGLVEAPGDPKLLALKAEIEKQKENQQQQQESQEGESDDQPSEQDQQQQQQENDDQQEGQQEQEQEGEGSDEAEQQQQQAPDEETPQEDEKGSADPDKLTKEQAERILQALQNEEGELLREARKIKGRPRRVEKDW